MHIFASLFILLCSLNTFAKDQWLVLDIEFYKKIELGAAHPFNPSGLVFDDGIQVLGPGKEMSPHATGAYLFENGLADRVVRTEVDASADSKTTIKVEVGGETSPRSLIIATADNFNLAGKKLGTHSMLLEAGVRATGTKEQPVFSENARCLLLTAKDFERPGFYFSRQRFSRFKNTQEFLNYNKAHLKQKLISFEQGLWGGHAWVKIRALGYLNRPYYIAAVEHEGRIYHASFFEKGMNDEFFKNCVAYNSVAIEDLRKFFKN
jgi:hypothetical protein